MILKDLHFYPEPGNENAPVYRWLVLDKGVVCAFGDDREGWKNFSDPAVVSCQGRVGTLGFTDSHCHLAGVGLSELEPDLTACETFDETLSLLKKAEAELKANAPKTAEVCLRARGWDQNRWKQWKRTSTDVPQLPSRCDLDSHFPHMLMALMRADGHCLWTNTHTLKFCGVTAATADPRGGRIERDAQGQPTGVLVDTAMDLVLTKIPKRTRAVLRQAYKIGMKTYAEAGFTAVHEAGVPQDWFEALCSLEGEPWPLRMWTMAEDVASWENLLKVGMREIREPQHMLARMHAKIYLDGAFGSRGAHLLAPYCDAPDAGCGVVLYEDSELQSWLARFLKRGLRMGFHAIGDGAAERLMALLSSFEFSPNTVRVEHAQMLTQQQVQWLAKREIVCAVQPIHAVSDGVWIESRVGRERLERVHRLRSLVDGGVSVVLSSDAPIESLALRHGLASSVSRKAFAPYESKNPFRPEEALDLRTTFRLFQEEPGLTMGVSALGSFGVGRWADFTFFEQPFWKNPVESWSTLKPVATMVAGKFTSGIDVSC